MLVVTFTFPIFDASPEKEGKTVFLVIVLNIASSVRHYSISSDCLRFPIFMNHLLCETELSVQNWIFNFFFLISVTFNNFLFAKTFINYFLTVLFVFLTWAEILHILIGWTSSYFRVKVTQKYLNFTFSQVILNLCQSVSLLASWEPVTRMWWLWLKMEKWEGWKQSLLTWHHGLESARTPNGFAW